MNDNSNASQSDDPVGVFGKPKNWTGLQTWYLELNAKRMCLYLVDD